MSDYIPHPDTEMHINQMSEDCLRALFTQLPVETQFKAGDVCRLWRTVRDALFRTQKSLTIKLNDYYRIDKTCLIIIGLNEERTAFLVAMFPSLTKLTIFSTNQNLFEEPASIAHLLVQYRDQLVTLKLHAEKYPESCKECTFTGDLLDVINTMSKLKQLSLHFRCDKQIVYPYHLSPFDLPILRQLDKLNLSCSEMSASIVTLWLPHLEARSTPMKISLNIDNLILNVGHSAFYDSITPKVASMFIHFPTIYCNLQQFQRLSTRFTNLTRLKLDDSKGDHLPYSSSVSTLMQALANLKQLTRLSIYTRSFDVQSSLDHLPQLPTVKEWRLTLIRQGEPQFSHALLSAWTANLSWLFPSLRKLSITLNAFRGCTDCDLSFYSEMFRSEEVANEKHCLRHQLRLIKQQQCSHLLSEAKMTYKDIPYYRRYCTPVRCTLVDIAMTEHGPNALSTCSNLLSRCS